MAELINPDNYQDFTLEMLRTPDGITKLNAILRQLANNISGDTENVRVYSGVGTPEASVAAGVGSLYMRTDGASDTSVYRKESGSGDTGWVAVKSPASLPLSVANGGFGADNSAIPQGYIPYMSATGVISWLAVGVSGQFLKTQGASANPTWDTITTPALTLISVTPVSSSTSSGNISITSTNNYFVVINGKDVSAATNTLGIIVNADTGNNYQSGYSGRGATAAISASNASTASIVPSTTLVASKSFNASFNIMQDLATSTKLNIFGSLSGELTTGGIGTVSNFGGTWVGGATPTTFAFTGTGNWTGTVYLYKLSLS